MGYKLNIKPSVNLNIQFDVVKNITTNPYKRGEHPEMTSYTVLHFLGRWVSKNPVENPIGNPIGFAIY